MSSIVKYNRVIVNTERRVLLDNTTLLKAQNKILSQTDEPEIRIDHQALVKRTHEQAESIILNARDKAQQIRVDAQIEAVEIGEIAKKEGYDQGYSEGYNKAYEQGLIEGKNQGRAEYDDLIAELEQLKQKYLLDNENLYKASEENMLRLAIDIARKIIGDAIESDSKAYTELAYKALKLVQGQKRVQLKVSSQDFNGVLENKDFLISRLEGIEDIDIVEDAFLERGSCIIDTGNGLLDGGVKTQMENIESTLAELARSIL